MKFLFDQNISFKVARKIQDLFPDSKHVSDLRLSESTDFEIWEYSKTNNFCIVTFDYDFIDLSTLKGFPPKIICLRTGNTATDKLISKIRSEEHSIKTFLNSSDNAFLELK
jgi:predicted nuclease of predicted toxin-antitoxin system